MDAVGMADRLRLTYETEMGVPNPAPWEQLAGTWKKVWEEVAFAAGEDWMSRRDHFAAAALQGVLSTKPGQPWREVAATVERVRELADAVLAELDKVPA